MERQSETKAEGANPTRDSKAEVARVREALRSIIDVAARSS
jgi:hypothetical protein